MKILAAMSGGVDSSVAAALLKDQGHEVVGITMKLWGGPSDVGCCSVSDVEDARRVADHLGIEHYVFNFGDQFEEFVVDPYVQSHQDGETPNPCIECNRHIKFKVLLDRSRALDFDAVATGHHAQIKKSDSGELQLRRGADPQKDQSYVLHMLSAEDMAEIMFPIGHMQKEEVRRLAQTRGLRTAHKSDSYEVCFIRKKPGRKAFLSERIVGTPARVVDSENKELGQVEALEFLTIGQRKGTGVQGKASPKYIVSVDAQNAEVRVGSEADMNTQTQAFRDPIYKKDISKLLNRELEVQCSSHGKPRKAKFKEGCVEWSQLEKLVAPGQSLVFYQGDRVVASAVASR